MKFEKVVKIDTFPGSPSNTSHASNLTYFMNGFDNDESTWLRNSTNLTQTLNNTMIHHGK